MRDPGGFAEVWKHSDLFAELLPEGSGEQCLATLERHLLDGPARLVIIDLAQHLFLARVGGYRSEAFRQAALASPLLTSTLLRPDASATAIVVYYARSGNAFADKRAFTERINQLAAQFTADTDLRYAITIRRRRIRSSVGSRAGYEEQEIFLQV